MKRDKPYQWKKVEDEMMLLALVVLTGSLLGTFILVNHVIWNGISEWYDNGGRIFRDKDGD